MFYVYGIGQLEAAAAAAAFANFSALTIAWEDWFWVSDWDWGGPRTTESPSDRRVNVERQFVICNGVAHGSFRTVKGLMCKRDK